MKNLIILSDGNNVCPEEIEAYFSGYDFIKTMFVKESDNKIVALVVSDKGVVENKQFVLPENTEIRN